MSGTAKWLIVGSAVVIALTALVALGIFTWMMFGGWMAGVNPWGPFSGGSGFAGMGSMMGNAGFGSRGMMGMSGSGMMYGRGLSAPYYGGAVAGDDFTLEVVEARLDNYLAGREDLVVGEIMIFDNHAYAQIIEAETGIGAMEVLVDPVALLVTPEHGPNMMWNLKYGGMHGGGMMGLSGAGMMGYGLNRDAAGEMTVSPEQAIEFAQAYLAGQWSADDHADPFYGYYTIHTLLDGEVVGMLSVNGYTGQVFLHTWHGTLLTMSEASHN